MVWSIFKGFDSATAKGNTWKKQMGVQEGERILFLLSVRKLVLLICTAYCGCSHWFKAAHESYWNTEVSPAQKSRSCQQFKDEKAHLESNALSLHCVNCCTNQLQLITNNKWCQRNFRKSAKGTSAYPNSIKPLAEFCTHSWYCPFSAAGGRE